MDKELDKQRGKEEEKLKRDMAARRAKLRAQAEMEKAEQMKQIDAGHGRESLEDGKLMIEEILRQKEQSAANPEMLKDHQDVLEKAALMGDALDDEAAKRKLVQEQMYYQQERERRFVEGIDQKEGLAADYEVQHEIKRLREGANMPFDVKMELSKEREELKRRIKESYEEDVKSFLQAQLRDVEDSMDAAFKQ